MIDKNNAPQFKINLNTKKVIDNSLKNMFFPTITRPGTFLEIFDQGVLLQGESAIGKSETALALIQKGHKFISDDVVKISKKDKKLIGSGLKKNIYLMEIRDIGIIDIAKLYGLASLRSDKVLNVIINLEKFDESKIYQRGNREDKYIDILNVNIPFHTIVVKPRRDIAMLIEVLILNLRVKSMGYRFKKEFNSKALKKMAKKEK